MIGGGAVNAFATALRQLDNFNDGEARLAGTTGLARTTYSRSINLVRRGRN
jgi:hypothetical protein